VAAPFPVAFTDHLTPKRTPVSGYRQSEEAHSAEETLKNRRPRHQRRRESQDEKYETKKNSGE